jgi:hypothetical protein
MMELGVGAVSQRVVEEAAKLKVAQIVASRRQVNATGGYIGLNQRNLVELVHAMSDGATKVIRDHGGPRQGGTSDDGTSELDEDITAGFDGIHIDVSALPRADQLDTLRNLLTTYVNRIDHIEVGGEHDEQSWNDRIFEVALPFRPAFMVVTTGTYAWADKQYGVLRTWKDIKRIVDTIHSYGVRAKAHNFDHIGDRRVRFGKVLDMYNIAPEFGMVEIDALLAVMRPSLAENTLMRAYRSNLWTRWFDAGKDEGTFLERAKCALRYMLHTDEQIIDWTALTDQRDAWVREQISQAIEQG